MFRQQLARINPGITKCSYFWTFTPCLSPLSALGTEALPGPTSTFSSSVPPFAQTVEQQSGTTPGVSKAASILQPTNSRSAREMESSQGSAVGAARSTDTEAILDSLDARLEQKRNGYGHHLKNEFCNPWPSYRHPSLWDVAKMLFTMRTSAVPRIPQPSVERMDWDRIRSPPSSHIQATWLGHASFLVQQEGLNILTDPVFCDRASPLQWIGPQRYTPLPFRIEELPSIDYVLISHNHYDHLDSYSVKALIERSGGDKIRWIVPLKLKSTVVSLGVNPKQVTELDWWESCFAETPLGGKSLRIVGVPAQHQTNRHVFDRMSTLWCGYAIIGSQERFYFSGDTGYRYLPEGDAYSEEEETASRCPAFREIGDELGPFDLCCIPIGAYNPRWFMSAVHVSPEDAVELFKDLRAKRALAMHWGTFVLTGEPVDEPPKRLYDAMVKKELNPEDFVAVKHGATCDTSEEGVRPQLKVT
eukprot:gb/GECG01001814.1/.p1 GENE.gb/GECG01001814.1/~~gb/GECG01001814.1/.p1  ORF type:complete len:474 (+),score=47.83 gb/GECG01001814.1/:1-1422(+)